MFRLVGAVDAVQGVLVALQGRGQSGVDAFW
jgi:hypothetical protein